ncbi:phosphotransferase [Solilutibacter silvestris]|uniref:phosphotransferase n=1 Tax=Solilutibacter silvestris TaxID=1645665 RepID=UPI003D343450
MSASPESIDIESLVPHKGTMCLWQRLLDHDDRHVRVASDGHRASDHPLRSDGRLKAIHLCEYGAQAMAVHGGLLGRARGGAVKAGVLVALRGVQLHVARIDDLAGELVGEAELLMDSDTSQQYGFRILHAGEVIAEGRAAVMLGEAG